jgi:transposase, IS5 family
LSFMRFLNLELCDNVPDCNTVWLFRENLQKAGAIEKLFYCFDKQLQERGLIANQGSIIGASFVDVPRQRNSRQENKEIKENKVPKDFQKNKNILSHKDLDARWTKKNDEKHYGYKNNVKVCKKSKLIENYAVTGASVHDSQHL